MRRQAEADGVKNAEIDEMRRFLKRFEASQMAKDAQARREREAARGAMCRGPRGMGAAEARDHSSSERRVNRARRRG